MVFIYRQNKGITVLQVDLSDLECYNPYDIIIIARIVRKRKKHDLRVPGTMS
ncbi:MAG: hypothetical protein K0S04_3373 [Herbinix sp.]|jgi:hypothetical protein|nr:hypothetical protein [Herbinix sp.]